MSLTFKKTCSTPLLIGGLCGDWNHGIWWLSIQLGIKHHPNWRTPSFFRGVGIPPTSYRLMGFPPRDLSSPNIELRDPTWKPRSSLECRPMKSPWIFKLCGKRLRMVICGWAGRDHGPIGPIGPIGTIGVVPSVSTGVWRWNMMPEEKR